jgi:hypothetical protein
MVLHRVTGVWRWLGLGLASLPADARPAAEVAA